MRKIFLFLLALVFSSMVFAQSPVEQLTEQEKIIFTINREEEDSTVIELLRKYDTDMRKGIKDKKPLSALPYYSFAMEINHRFVKYRWFIADTGLSRKWLKDIYELLMYMSKTQGYITSSKFNGQTQTAKYQQAVKYFNTAYERFVNLIKKPVKVSAKAQREAQGQKLLWQKEMREKYKIRQR